MRTSYCYYENATVINDYQHALAIIKEENLIIDIKHLPLLQEASDGNFNAMCELAKAFSEGSIQGIPKNYRLARLFTDEIISRNNLLNDPHIMVEAYRNSGLLERNFKNYPAASKEFTRAIKIMCDEVNPFEWDYEVHQFLYEVTIGKTPV